MTFTLTDDQLLDIAGGLARDIKTGLATDESDILAIPAFIPLDRSPGSGTVLALDVGGTNARCAVVSLDDRGRLTVEQGPLKRKIPVSRGEPTDPAEFLDVLARLIQDLNPPRGLPTGYCFSYPARPTPDRDAVILDWTKELFVRDTIGRKAGQILRRHLDDKYPGLMGREVTVINDTVATLLAGLAESTADGNIGLIIGTGTNMAIMLSPDHIPKLSPRPAGNSPLPVNLESGNFKPPHLNHWDEELDASSHNPSRQRFEKAVSGFYLPGLFKLACPDSSVNPADSSAVLIAKAWSANSRDFSGSPDRAAAAEADMARQILERSARLIAAALAGAFLFLKETTGATSVSITVEGALYQSHPRYKEIMTDTLDVLSRELNLDSTAVTIQTVANANLTGCAMAGLAGLDQAPPGP
ncbi:MAG: hexokinase family protein [Desulfosudaceae bacterium]